MAPPVEVEVAVVLDLLDAACAAGSSIPGALASVGTAIGGTRGDELVRAAAVLALGGGWAEAWTGPAQPAGQVSTRSVPAEQGPGVRVSARDRSALKPVTDALEPSWQDGAPPAGALRAAAQTVRRDRHTRALDAASRLGVRLVLPLGLCYLPAFVLVGLVPVLLSMAVDSLGT